METLETLETLKRCFFTELYELDTADDTLNDVDNVLANLRAAKPVRKGPTSSQTGNSRRANCTQHQFPLLRTTVSAPTGLISEKAKLPPAEPLPHDGEIQADAAAAPVLRPTVTEGLESHSRTAADRQNLRARVRMAPTAKGKRKRGRSLELLPEAQQIFRGLKFYFLPNDDVAPARKLRIAKVLERGATWIKQWDNDMTHIIIDRDLTYNDLLKYLKRSSIPLNIAVVNEHYPAECIQYRTLVNPDQALYRVRGHPQNIVRVQEGTGDSAVDPLPLKPEKRSNAEPSATPAASEQLSDPSPTVINTAICAPPSQIHRPGSKLPNGPADALDVVIQEMIAVKDL
ncbi:MAG: hypothetical protein Q9178_000415, partial [Gyalolechia marmorata]